MTGSEQPTEEQISRSCAPCGAPKFMLGYEAWAESFPVRRVDLDQP